MHHWLRGMDAPVYEYFGHYSWGTGEVRLDLVIAENE